MWYKPYGRTGKEISVIGFGGMRFPNPTDIDTNAELVLYAHSKGINYLDTAPGYCADKSEEIMGAAIRQMKPGSFYVSTKSGKPKADDFRRDLEKSLKRLGVPKIHFQHIWCVVTMDGWKERISGGAVAEALKAKREGLIEHVVVSSHLAGADLAKMLEEGEFEGVTLGYCAINFPYRQQAVDAAGKMGIGLVTMNPLGGGLIPRHADRFNFIRGPRDANVVEAAIRFNISQPAITSALVGFSSKEQVDQAVAAVENFKPYDAAHIESVRKTVMGTFNSLCTGCGYCLPCPQGVPIPQMMDAYNFKLLDGKEDAIQNRLAWHWDLEPAAAQACSLCGQCLEKCTQRLPIPERMTEIGKLPPRK